MNNLLIFPAALGNRFPTTRSQGRARRGELEDALDSQPIETVIVDFREVEAMTISYIDEFLGKLLASFDERSGGLVLAIQNANQENLEAVQIALERRGSNVVMIGGDNKLTLLGHPRPRATFQAADQLGTFGAGDLADLLDISPQNANNRLKPLVVCGAIRKARVTGAKRGGKEFIYSTLTASQSATVLSR